MNYPNEEAGWGVSVVAWTEEELERLERLAVDHREGRKALQWDGKRALVAANKQRREVLDACLRDYQAAVDSGNELAIARARMNVKDAHRLLSFSVTDFWKGVNSAG